MDLNEEELFHDDIGSAIRRLNKTPRLIVGNTPSESAVGQPSPFSTAVASSQSTWLVCIVCFSSSTPIWQCRKCFVKACETCRKGRAGQGQGIEANWTCTSCGKSGTDLNVLLQAPIRRTSRVTKKGELKNKPAKKQRTRKRQT